MAHSSFALRVATLASCAVTFGLAACSSDSLIPTAAPSASASRDAGGAPNGGDGSNGNNGNAFANGHVKVCAVPPAGEAGCHSWITVDKGGQPQVTINPAGYDPADLQTAYGLPALGGSGQTVAIVDAYDDPNAEADLKVYRANFDLPLCTTANGCFKKINQNGGRLATASERGLGGRDLARSRHGQRHLSQLQDPARGSQLELVRQSRRRGRSGGEDAGRRGDLQLVRRRRVFDRGERSAHYNHPGIAVTVSSGDSGYGVEFPAASQFVTAVGGTHLTHSGSGYSETAWSGAGSGCSAYITKPTWQLDSGCSQRTVADVSAVADPNTGVAVYDTYGFGRRGGGWLVFGGTSVAAPIVGAVYALANNLGANTYGSLSYGHAPGLFDVSFGSNGSCGGSYLCTAGAGYDGPTGNGSPRGTGAF